MKMKCDAILLSVLQSLYFIAASKQTSVCPEIVSRLAWGGRAPVQVEYGLIPTKYVIIHHTVTPTCDTEIDCAELLANMQSFHMDELQFHDIGYNFLIGGDGQVYEGTGWRKVGAHTYGYNSRSLGIAFIGNFNTKLPTKKQLEVCKKLLLCAVERGDLHPRYKLLGGRQVSRTQSPGLKLYKEIQNWSNFAAVP